MSPAFATGGLLGFGFGFVNTVSGAVFCSPPDGVEPDAGVESATGEPETAVWTIASLLRR